MTTLNTIKNMYPKTRKNSAVTGYIPMKDFNANEPAFRKVMHEHGLRAIYRGSRVSNNLQGFNKVPSMTMRCDATHVVLYYK